MDILLSNKFFYHFFLSKYLNICIGILFRINISETLNYITGSLPFATRSWYDRMPMNVRPEEDTPEVIEASFN